MMFQPLTGPGYKVNKKAATVEEIRAEIQRRLTANPGTAKVAVPAIIPADRGRHTANWTAESWAGVPMAAQEVIAAVMAEFDVEQP
jgi:hypothetical protein